ncbi:MAG: imidazole glycerol phosphate synthase subunit HisH [Alphaproteobacteria bacterium]|nr:imidazole glycerol phosphate synthase subunit HisH [Alphaproteobacteria bacterium]
MAEQKIVIVNYGMGNLGSISNMIKKVGYRSEISSDIDVIRSATKLILPGIGAFAKGISNLNKFNLIDVLNEKVIGEKTPILGICLGMQLMTKYSEEGNVKGLNWIDADVKLFELDDLKVPHMGWNVVEQTKKSELFIESKEDKRFYFVHSFYVSCSYSDDILTKTPYGIDFVSSFEKGNVYGTQFHPEKSHKFGMNLIKNFIEKI